ncbi:hypothetical protein [Streptomyces sp. NPDC002537]
MTRLQPWDLGGTLSGGPSLHELALAEEERLPTGSAAPAHRRLPVRTPEPSRRASRSAAGEARIVAALTRLAGTAPDRRVLEVLDRQLRRLVWRDHAEGIRAAIEQLDLPPDRLHRMGRWFTTYGEHAHAVAFGIVLLGAYGTDEDRDVLLTFGVYGEFAKEVCEALTHSQTGAHRVLVALAERSKGWPRVHAVEALIGATDPGIKEWLVRDACGGDVLDGYFARNAAVTCDLAGVLARDQLDEETLNGAGRLLAALADVESPGATLFSYPDARRALEGYARHCVLRGPSLKRLTVLALIDRCLGTPGATRAEWQPDGFESTRSRFAELLSAPDSRSVVIHGLADKDPAVFRRAAWLARLLGVPYHSALLGRVESMPLDTTVWYLLVDACPAEEITAVAAAAERLLPLDRLRSGPADANGFGPDFAADNALDMIVSRLDEHPGIGWPLITAALGNRTRRNRHMAMKAIASWPVHLLPPEARTLLLAAHSEEPDEELGTKMRQELERL